MLSFIMINMVILQLLKENRIIFYEIYYGKIGHPKSFNFVFKKIIYNCNKFFKHAEQMKIYCKNKYEK